MTFHEIAIPVLTTTMPIILLFTTRLLSKGKTGTSEAPNPDVMTIITEFPDIKLRVALLEDRVRKLINGKYTK